MKPSIQSAFSEILKEVQSNLESLTLLDCRRLFHGRGGCWEDAQHFNVEKYGQWVTLVFYSELDENFWIAEFGKFLDSTEYHLAIQRRWLSKSPWEFPGDVPPQTYRVTENGLDYILKFDRQNPGLFLDMRAGRSWVKQHSNGKKIANLFSFTCGFSVAAAYGGATETINMDMSKAALSRGRENVQLNRLGGSHKYLAHDISKSLGKITRLGPYDLVIIDPPTKQKSFDPVAQYNRILKRCHEWVVTGGQLMLTLNDPVISVNDFIEQATTFLVPDFVFEKRLLNPDEIKERDPDKGLKVLIFKRV